MASMLTNDGPLSIDSPAGSTGDRNVDWLLLGDQ